MTDLDALDRIAADTEADARSKLKPGELAALLRIVRATIAYLATEPESWKYPGPGDQAALIALEEALSPFWSPWGVVESDNIDGYDEGLPE